MNFRFFSNFKSNNRENFTIKRINDKLVRTQQFRKKENLKRN